MLAAARRVLHPMLLSTRLLTTVPPQSSFIPQTSSSAPTSSNTSPAGHEICRNIDYASFTLQRLSNELHHRSLNPRGTKAMVIRRLEAHDNRTNRAPSICLKPRIITPRIPIKTSKELARASELSQNLPPNTYTTNKFRHGLRGLGPSTPVRRFSSMPAAMPSLVDDVGDAAPPPRVPFLPDNDFARYHRQKFVAAVAPPHKPAIAMVEGGNGVVAVSSALGSIVDREERVEFRPRG